MVTNLQLFLYTIEEYNRFATCLPIREGSQIADEYAELDYVAIQTRLMLLRKYYSKGGGNVYFKNLIAEAQKEFAEKYDELQGFADAFNDIYNQQLQHILTDGTKQTLYDTIEDTVYGLYLHADESKIIRLLNTHDAIRYICIRKFILEVEALVIKLANKLKEYGVTSDMNSDTSRSPLIYMGDPDSNSQDIHASQYWSNIYGHDATDGEISEIVNQTTSKDNKILAVCVNFMTELNGFYYSVSSLKKYIHPLHRWNWGDFSVAKDYFSKIPNPGLSTKVRYNSQKTRAYVRVFHRVDGGFIMDTPHIISEIYQFNLVKWFGKWYIVSFEGQRE